MAGFNFGTPASTTSFTLGSNTTTGGTSGFNFGASNTTSTTPGLQFNAPSSTTGNVTFGAPAATGGSGFTFGSSGGLSLGTPAANPAGNLTFGSTQATPQTGLSFATPSQATPSFGSTPATTQTISFGSTLAATTPALSFGSTPAASQPLSFGSTPATKQTISFGSTPAATPPALSFGSTPAASQPLSFGSTPAATTQTISFGSTTAATTQAVSFGSTPATSQPLSFSSTPATTQSLNFGATPATTLSFGSSLTTTQPLSFGTSTQPTLSFGSTPATTQATLNFGLSTPATTASTGLTLPTTTANKGVSFNLGGQTAVTKPGLSFGTTTTTSTPSLLNFSTPKTTGATGFSLSVSTGAGTGSLFSVPTTSSVPTSSAPTPFKGLGGIDTTTTQGSGPKDTKSAKENLVNPEILQTVDTFKNFVKQQKNLSCEVSRAPVKPMHKVTEDVEALKKLLTSVSSGLQKNVVMANKLKSDTTKCLLLCEMAQRTHDTPPGLQNDNVAPLEYFVQLASKFERDIHKLRQEIDNTEKHVNSLAYPSILTPQELSVALRRLHDSFVALAGRLQTAHAGVIAQKERHLSLRRHFLKDHTNIFETPSRTARKPLCPVGLPKPGPTPFSSMGGIPNISMMSGHDKHVTFATGPTSLTGWGVSSLSSTNTSTLLQSPGQAQTLDSQNFQLGKPPVGNKRGKR